MSKELELLNYALRLAHGLSVPPPRKRAAEPAKAPVATDEDTKTLPEVGRRLIAACARRGLLPRHTTKETTQP